MLIHSINLFFACIGSKVERLRLVKSLLAHLLIVLLVILVFPQVRPAYAAPPVLPPAAPPSTQPPATVSFEPEHACTISGVAADGSWIVITEAKTAVTEQSAPLTASIPTPVELRDLVKQYHAGDRVFVRLRTDNTGLASLRPQRLSVNPPQRLIALAIPFMIILFVYLILKIRSVHISDFIVGQDGRYSNSKSQISLWLFVVISVYFATYCLRAWYWGGALFAGPSIPLNLGLLSGLSAASFCGAKTITSSMVDREVSAIGVNTQGAPPAPPPALGGSLTASVNNSMKFLRQKAEDRVKPTAILPPSLFRDLFKDDHERSDFGDMQMVVVTVLASLMYIFTAYQWLGSIELVQNVTLPDIDSTILTLFGLGQGAYLVKKSVGNGA